MILYILLIIKLIPIDIQKTFGKKGNFRHIKIRANKKGGTKNV
jgi:hypothetical protein